MNRPRRATLVWTRRVGPNVYHQRFSDSLIARRAKAGQFVHLLPGSDHLFRRALSVYATDPRAETFDVLHQVLGAGTRCLAHQPIGTVIDTLGPLGNSFTPPARGTTPVLVGGGLGMAPLRLWAAELMAARSTRRGKPVAPIMILGVRTRELAVAPYQLRTLHVHPHWATDDGSLGFHGTAVDLFADMLRRNDWGPGHAMVYGCGPEPMMKALAELCIAQQVPCEVSLERSMPCGYGVCMGCVVTSRGASGYETYRRVCRDGPVFDAAAIVF
ncbi:MAG: dihydroorotate dehydrogenase electron transfer subunit [Candidatus Zixiibacteriota bacterium]